MKTTPVIYLHLVKQLPLSAGELQPEQESFVTEK